MLPPESDAKFLVETLLSFVGVSQQFFDPRDVLDQVDQLYENPEKLRQDSILRFCETILVLSVGIQFAVKSTERKKNPGIELFDFAMGSLPSVSTWRATSTAIMAMYGFFDLDAIFSAAFSVILDSVMNTHARTANSTWLNSACHLLLVMGECGNAAAATRRVEILRICEHLSLPFEPDEQNRSIPGVGTKPADVVNRVDDVAATLTSLRQGNLPPYSTAPPPEFAGVAQTIGVAGLTDDTVSPFAQLEDMFDIQAFLGADEQQNGEALLSEHVAAEGATIDDGDFSWLYQDSDFALTGADMTDWEVFGRYLNIS
ncbi:hypothetical protein ACHAQH_007000 [Verticillium albo-atrum]